MENPRFLVLLFETEADTESLGGGGAGAALFSKGFRVLEDDLFFCLVFGVQTIPFITTPFTISSRLMVSLSVEPLWSRLSLSPPGLVVMLELEAVEASGNGADVEDPEISEDDGTFTQRLRRQV